MALSNIFNEPRREITESAIGIAVFAAAVGVVVLPGYIIASHIKDSLMPFGMAWFLSSMFVVFCYVFLLCILQLTHIWGDAACDALEGRGIQMRPLQRYRRRRKT